MSIHAVTNICRDRFIASWSALEMPEGRDKSVPTDIHQLIEKTTKQKTVSDIEVVLLVCLLSGFSGGYHRR